MMVELKSNGRTCRVSGSGARGIGTENNLYM